MESLDTSSIAMISVFVIGYFLITIEHLTHINKTTVALLVAVICWGLEFGNNQWAKEEHLKFLGNHLANISQVIYFLIGALTVVEIISAHNGFKVISDNINVTSQRKLLWAIGFITFFLSAVLDNLTTTIVMVSFLHKILQNKELRWVIGGGVVIAANAGGAWTPIGDITTTMLWIGGQISSMSIMKSLFVPSLVSMVVAFVFLSFMVEGEIKKEKVVSHKSDGEPLGTVIFWLGLLCLVSVPVFKVVTGLPPFMGILFGLGILWFLTDLVHRGFADRHHLRVPQILTKVDLSSTLFFLGILLAITALDSAGLLEKLAHGLDHVIGNSSLIAVFIGLASAVVDNVPLVAAAMGMYDLTRFPQDSSFWELVAFCSGTGGSILIIGSAAGVVFMGLEKVDFYWYLKRISLPALIGYFAGVGVYLLVS